MNGAAPNGRFAFNVAFPAEAAPSRLYVRGSLLLEYLFTRLDRISHLHNIPLRTVLLMI